jgi:hypothetical protein
VTKRIRPIVDEADVDRFADIVKESKANMSAEERADTVSQIALGYARLKGFSPAGGRELARNVRQRALWTTPADSSEPTT